MLDENTLMLEEIQTLPLEELGNIQYFVYGIVHCRRQTKVFVLVKFHISRHTVQRKVMTFLMVLPTCEQARCL